MKDVEHDLDRLREEWTPKQRENWENHCADMYDNLQYLGSKPEIRECEALDTDAAAKWYLRTYRPKKRGSGMMERDHVQIGEPERYFKKYLVKLNDVYGSIYSMMMDASLIDEETREEIEDAAMAVFAARHVGRPDAFERKLREHDEVAELYGFVDEK